MDFSSDPYIAEQQVRAVVFCLVAFAYIDTDFALSEKAFIRDYLASLADRRAKNALGDDIPRADIVERWTKHYHELLDEYDATIRSHFTESVAEGETTRQFVLSRLKLGCFELLRHFDRNGQQAIMATVSELMHADGVVSPEEQAFINEIVELVNRPIELDEADLEPIEDGTVIIDQARELPARMTNHPWFSRFEWDFARDKQTFDVQSAGDLDLMKGVRSLLDRQREQGNGRLAQGKSFGDFVGDEPFLDGHVYVIPPKPSRDYELLVVGDLHGCYSCLKAALMQADFFTKAQAFRDDPTANPAMYVVFLGDYIDRGKFSYSGTLRTILQLFTSMPDQVFTLRGNHEYYIELAGRVVAPVRPCEAMDSISKLADNSVFRGYMELFETLPTSLAFGKVFFVHGGIPRADTLEEKWKGLQSLNDPEIRFQMMWSDPSEADAVPLELQRENARFPFGRKQFQQFMAKIGCRMMVRGHERVVSGFAKIYDDPEAVLVSLFSAGGATNEDLPPKSNYRDVTPMALTIRHAAGVTTLTPFLLDYARYNDPKYNAFFQRAIETL
jgi:hypothetical protein